MLCVGIYAFVFCTYRSVVTHVKQFVIKQRSSGRTSPEMSGIPISLTILKRHEATMPQERKKKREDTARAERAVSSTEKPMNKVG